MYYATFFGHDHIIAELGKKEVPYEISYSGTTCLHVAAKRGLVEVVNQFMDYKTLFDWKVNHPWDGKIDVNARKNHKKGTGVTPAFLAAKNGHIDIFKKLHAHGALIEGVRCSIGGN